MSNPENSEPTYTAFRGHQKVAAGSLPHMLRQAKAEIDTRGADGILIFDDRTGHQVDYDFRGSFEEVWARVAPTPRQPGPGRPRLGVVGREVSLMPAHWEWLEAQPNGASAALRRLVEEARKRDPAGDRARLDAAAASRFMWALAGDLSGFEEASRALFARDGAKFRRITADWPGDVRAHLEAMTAFCFPGQPA